MSRNSSTALGNVPKEVQEHVRNLLSITPSLRPDVHLMSKVGGTVRVDVCNSVVNMSGAIHGK